MKINQTNKKNQIIELFKLFSSIPLLSTIILEIEILLFLIIKSFSKNLILTILFILLFHYILIHYSIEHFLYLIQFPILGKSSLYSNGCSKANGLIISLSNFIDICEKIVENEVVSLSEEYSNILVIYEKINMLIYIYYEMKKRYGLSKNQKKLYELLVIWRKHFKKYKIIQYFKDNKRYKENHSNIMFNKRLIHLIMDSNFIIKIAEDFVSDNYHFLSFKKIYNYFFNDTFCSIYFFKTIFNLKFKENSNKFITSDNKVIDFTIIDSKKIVKEITNSISFKLNNKNKKENEDLVNNLSKIEDENSSSTNLSILKNNHNIKNKRNLIIFSNPNSMIYEFFTPEKYFFYYEGGCDILFWNYRGYGLSEGHSTFDNNKTDILELFDELKKMNKWEKIGVHGYSIGGISATYLAKNRNIDLLISDRNFSSVCGIAESYPFGGIMKNCCKFFLLDRVNNEKNYLFTKNIKCCKIILCDPCDEVVVNNGSVKSSISKYIIKTSITNNKYENFLDYIFRKEKSNFINSLLNIINFLDNNCLIKENVFIQYLNNFFNCFIYGSEDLINFRYYYYKRLKILHIHNFFNNFIVWGTKNDDEKENKIVYYNTNNNISYLDKAINILNLMSNMENQLLKLKQNNSNSILIDVEVVKNGLIKIKNEIKKINFSQNISKGFLVRLNCGHNTIFTGREENIVVKILENINFLK